MKIIGIDIGNKRTKVSNLKSFNTTIRNGYTERNKNEIKVEYEGKKYTIGASNGRLNLGKNKYEKIDYDLAILTAIANSSNETVINCNVVTGLPIEKFHNDKIRNDLKSKLLEYENKEIFILNEEGKEKKLITIEDAEVYMESGIVFLNKEHHRNIKKIVLDFGGSTTDISLWDGLTLMLYKTYPKGMIDLGDKISKDINIELGKELAGDFCEGLIGKKEFNNEDISFIDDTINAHLTELTSYIYQYFPLDEVNEIEGIGGGAKRLKEYLKKEYKDIEIKEDAEYQNALVYKEIGRMIWE